MQPGQTVVLRSYEPDLGVNAFARLFEGGKDRFDVLELRAADDLVRSAALPDTLAQPPDLVKPQADVDIDRTFRLQGNKINGRSMDPARIDEVVEVNTTEVWEVKNTDGNFYDFHVHDVQFQILTIDSDPPPAEYAGWKDTVFLPPGGTAHIALRFSDYTDPDHPYMLHCHPLRHEDQGMMGQFVIEPGERTRPAILLRACL